MIHDVWWRHVVVKPSCLLNMSRHKVNKCPCKLQLLSLEESHTMSPLKIFFPRAHCPNQQPSLLHTSNTTHRILGIFESLTLLGKQIRPDNNFLHILIIGAIFSNDLPYDPNHVMQQIMDAIMRLERNFSNLSSANWSFHLLAFIASTINAWMSSINLKLRALPYLKYLQLTTVLDFRS